MEQITERLTLADFLLARYADEETIARDVEPEHYEQDAWDGMTWHCVEPLLQTFSPARVLAECEAKRRIVELHGTNDAWCDYCSGHSRASSSCPTVRLLALPYADHPDFNEEWRP